MRAARTKVAAVWDGAAVARAFSIASPIDGGPTPAATIPDTNLTGPSLADALTTAEAR